MNHRARQLMTTHLIWAPGRPAGLALAKVQGGRTQGRGWETMG